LELVDADTTWVFLSGSDEDRFLDDISFGVECLKYRGFPESNILIFVDQPSGLNIFSKYSFPGNLDFYPTAKVDEILSDKKPQKLVIIVTGHGNQNGIHALPGIQAHSLLTLIKNLPNLKYCLLVLGQCYAGTFNFLEARSLNSSGDVILPEVCIIGATDLHVSLSLSISISSIPNLDQFNCTKSWLANSFLFSFMWYVAIPTDTDGDGRFSVLDAYKSAGIITNQLMLQVKQNAFMEIYNTLLTSTVGEITNSLSQQLAQKAKDDLIQAFEIILTNQNSWILHANLARKLEL
jgi:hypothetical protein